MTRPRLPPRAIVARQVGWLGVGLLVALASLATSPSSAGNVLPPMPAATTTPEIRPFRLGLQLAGEPITVDRLIAETIHAGLWPSLVGFYRQWPASNALDLDQFPATSCEAIWAFGAMPVITWEPMVVLGTTTAAIPAAEILGGAYDPFLRRWARAARDWGRPLVIRFAHEMNLVHYHWGTTRQEYGPASPRLYRRLWRHVVTIFRQEQATQVLWAFCPNHHPDPAPPDPQHPDHPDWNTFAAWFPGSAWVDLVGVDGYNWGTSRLRAEHGWDSTWLSFAELFRGPATELRRLAPDLPLVIWETACSPQGGDRVAWLAEALTVAPHLGIDSLLWFQVDKEQAWALTATETAALAHLLPPPDRPDWRPWLRRPGP